MKKQVLALVLVLLMASFVVYATEHLIPLQGYASDSSSLPLSEGNISVRVYDAATSGNLIYDSGTDFDNTITDGIFDVVLGSITPLDLNNTKKYYMEVDINGEEVVGDATSGREAFWPGGGDHSHNESWNDLQDIPAGFSDGVDDISSLWKVSGNNVYRQIGNVGIGTVNPSAKLDVEVSSGGAATIGSSGNSATGDYAIAMGYDTTASGLYSTAMGTFTTASGGLSTAMGIETTASGEASTAMGYGTTASGPRSPLAFVL